MTRPTPTPDDGDWYAATLAKLKAKPHPTEADVSGNLIRPVLERELGFDGASEIEAEARDASRRPDYICRKSGSRTVSIVVEVKNLGINLMQRTNPARWASAPIGQLQSYVNGVRGCGEGTFGVVTNGEQWIVIRRGKHAVPATAGTNVVHARTLAEIRETLSEILSEIRERPRQSARLVEDEKTEKTDWLSAIERCETPEEFLESTGFDDATVSEDGNAAWAHVADYRNDDELLPNAVHVICLRLNYPDGRIGTQDIMGSLAEISAIAGSRVAGVAYTDERETQEGKSHANARRMCRAFLRHEGRLSSTTLIDTALPGSRAERQIETLAEHGTAQAPKKALDALSSVPLESRFHEEIGTWFAKTKQHANDLRHLIRILFVWLLQQRGVLPDSALWDPASKPSREFSTHDHIEHLFYETLAVPEEHRTRTIDTIPFLNGSLFAKPKCDEKPTRLPNTMYLNDDGLLSILARYDWTLCDRTGYGSESALDPSMLGQMFEQLILKVDGVRLEQGRSDYAHRKMPKGTYYTPQDIVDEMTADALAGWLCDRMPEIPEIEWKAARGLIHSDADDPQANIWQTWAPSTKRTAHALLCKVSVFDPCCGSGAFTLSMLHALHRTCRKLSPNQDSHAEMESIIERQLHAVDIHPLAVMITRLRLFIALIDARLRSNSEETVTKPLPNLETRCMCADTLHVEVSRQHSFGGDEIDERIEDLRAAREQWTAAHYPDEKTSAIEDERNARKALRTVAQAMGTAEDLAWLDRDFLSATAEPATFDIRKLFPAPKGGFDIVIGNPPYQTPDADERSRAERLGYHGTKNLYLLFIEAAIEVSKPEGCVTFVVPHSLCFNRQTPFRHVRQAMERVAKHIDIRTYDNMPQPLFPPLPWLKSTEHGTQNRQRATVFSLRKGGGAVDNGRRPERPEQTEQTEQTENASPVRSRGYIRLRAGTRSAILKTATLGCQQPKYEVQWTQAPTAELAELLSAMRRDIKPSSPTTRTMHHQGQIVTFPRRAMYFLSCLPHGTIENEERKKWHLNDDTLYWPWIGLYNSHLFHVYWLMVGDVFNVTTHEYGTITPRRDGAIRSSERGRSNSRDA